MPHKRLPASLPAPSVQLSWPGKHLPPGPNLAGFPSQATTANLLLHTDNLRALAWIERHADTIGRVACCAIDPPYATQVDHGVRLHAHDALAYSDRWSDAEYCQAMYERAHAIHRILAPAGFLFVQCDWRASAWWRLILDEVFGGSCFRNEIQWRRAPNLGRQAASRQLGRTLDSIFVYSRTPGAEFPGELPTLLKPVPLSSTGRPQGAKWDARAKHWYTTAPRGDYTDASIARLRQEGRVHESRTGTLAIKYPLVQNAAGVWCKAMPLDTLWDDEGVRPLRHATKKELAIAYVTQKPEALLRRIIAWASKPGDLVLDCFCGSGTTLAAAHALGRRWIGVDQSPMAIEVTTSRMRDLGAAWTTIVDPENVTTSHARASSQASPRALRVTRRKTSPAPRRAQ